MKKVLVFGGRSFLGGHICRALIKRDYHVVLHSSSSAHFKNVSDILPHPAIETLVCPLDDVAQLEKTLNECDYVIYSAIPYPKQSLGRMGQLNHEIVELDGILKTISQSNIKKSVFVSVCGTIGEAEPFATEADKRSEEGLNSGLKNKVISENLIFKYIDQGLKATIVNPAVFVGEYDYNPSTGEFFRFFLQAPIAALVDHKFNIIGVEDVALGAVLALEKGQLGHRYLLCANNITFGDFIRKVRELDGKKMPRIALSERTAIIMAHLSEAVNMVIRSSKPLIPIMGIDLTRTMQHYSIQKARDELGFEPQDAWKSVEKAYAWYKKNGIL